MNFQEYEREYFILYSEFAATVASILDKAITVSKLPRPQSIQNRAKSLVSLKGRLDKAGQLESQSIELHRRDLAGVRIIFYTNNDVNRFLSSSIIFENFEVDREATRIHHPTADNEGTRYRATHFMVELKADRASLPEYARFKDEIQIQTILHHAWSETSHDIAYKNELTEGFGSRAMEEIRHRFNRIMDKYLVPAGYEFQRVQHDYERLQQGKELFDRDILRNLASAPDNNERHSLITSLKEHVIPNYDDVNSIYNDLIVPLVNAAIKAKDVPTKKIEYIPGHFTDGKSASDVAIAVLETLEMLRYYDIDQTFRRLCDIYKRYEGDEVVEKKVLDTTKRLAEYNLDLWNKYGAGAQRLLSETLNSISPKDKAAARSVFLAAWKALLGSELNGTTWRANSVVLKSAAVPANAEISKIREEAISGLMNLFDDSTSVAQMREARLALNHAASIPTQSGSDQLLQLILRNIVRLVKFFTERTEKIPYDLLETMEEGYLWEYYRARGIVDDINDRFGCKHVAKELMDALIAFRDKINADPNFVRFKTLVGFEAVFAEQWDDEHKDFKEIEKHRSEEVDRFVDTITTENEDDWLAFVEQCASIKSNDLATFPIFQKFLTTLSAKKPEIAERFLKSASASLSEFLVPFLNGLYQSGNKTVYLRVRDGLLAAGDRLPALIVHYRVARPPTWLFAVAVLEKAIEVDDTWAVNQCVLYAIEIGDAENKLSSERFFTPAMNFLNSKNDARWVRAAWFGNEKLGFFERLTNDEAELLIENFNNLPRLELQTERMLTLIAKKYLQLVWRFLARRAKEKVERERDDLARFEAFPYQFHDLGNVLSSDANIAVSSVKQFYTDDDYLFRFTGGRLLATAFPKFSTQFSEMLKSLVLNGTESDCDFVLAIMENYKGELATHEVLKAIIEKYPDSQTKWDGVSISFDNTGVVHGEFGFVEALRAKRLDIEPWLNDTRQSVRNFAEEHIRGLDLRIIDEQKRAEDSIAMRKLLYENDEDSETDE